MATDLDGYDPLNPEQLSNDDNDPRGSSDDDFLSDGSESGDDSPSAHRATDQASAAGGGTLAPVFTNQRGAGKKKATKKATKKNSRAATKAVRQSESPENMNGALPGKLPPQRSFSGRASLCPTSSSSFSILHSLHAS